MLCEILNVRKDFSYEQKMPSSGIPDQYGFRGGRVDQASSTISFAMRPRFPFSGTDRKNGGVEASRRCEHPSSIIGGAHL